MLDNLDRKLPYFVKFKQLWINCGLDARCSSNNDNDTLKFDTYV